jgi:hypothetical protein
MLQLVGKIVLCLGGRRCRSSGKRKAYEGEEQVRAHASSWGWLTGNGFTARETAGAACVKADGAAEAGGDGVLRDCCFEEDIFPETTSAF